MFASDAFAYNRLNAAADRNPGAPRRFRMRRVIAWLVGGLDEMDMTDVIGEPPAPYLANDHLRRDIGLPPITRGSWPY